MQLRNKEICHCSAFPWPHALLLSRRCEEQHGVEFSISYDELGWNKEWSEEARLDARERAEASNAAR